MVNWKILLIEIFTQGYQTHILLPSGQIRNNDSQFTSERSEVPDYEFVLPLHLIPFFQFQLLCECHDCWLPKSPRGHV